MITNYLWMHALSILENLRGLCVTVSVLRSLCYGLCVCVDFIVLLSSLSLYAVILVCHFTLYFCASSHVVGFRVYICVPSSTTICQCLCSNIVD